MEIDMSTNGRNGQVVADPVPLPEALKQNTIVFFETGTGKTLIAIMLLRSYAHLLRKPSPYIAVFLVPTVVLVTQQGEVVAKHTDLKVGEYYGEMGVDYWDAATWKDEKDKYEVLVMTPQILLNALRHRFLRLDQVKVLIFDECHNARGKHPYACIMTEFYHRELASSTLQLPRVFGMTASPIKAKASSSAAAYWKQIKELETLMNSKVFTCYSDSVLTQFIPFSTPKVKIYSDMDAPRVTSECLTDDLINLRKKHELSLNTTSVSDSIAESAKKRLDKLFSTFIFCLTELGVWLAMKAAEVYSREEDDIFIWGQMDASGNRVVRAFSSDAVKVFSASMPSGLEWSIRYDLIDDMKAGYLTPKVICLVQTLLEYREMKELRCIIFVERIVTAIVIRSLLNELLPEFTGWRTEYTAGNNSRLQSQSRKEQNAIVDEFRKGKVNIIVATSMLEEGLDVQSCNLVIRFDPSATVCSFIQSRGRARMQNSDFVLMVKRYFKPYPRCTINKELGSCTLHLPSSCPVQTITVQGEEKFLKQLACLEACRKLHQVGALTDNLVPDILEEEAEVQESGYEPYSDECAKYLPPELVGSDGNTSETLYNCYVIELSRNFEYDINLQDIVLAVHTRLDDDLERLNLDLDVDRGKLNVRIKHIGSVTLNCEQVALCHRFQLTLFRVLIDHKLNKLHEELHEYSNRNGSMFNYLLLPSIGTYQIDWKCVNAVLCLENASWNLRTGCSKRGYGHYNVHTKNGLVCCCMLENSLVATPHNNFLYCITGILDGIDGNTYFKLRDGESVTYKEHYRQSHGINLQFERESLLHGKRIFTVHNYLQRCRIPSVKAANLKRMLTDHCMQNVVIPTLMVLEAITTKKCQEKIHLESLETLGDSFLKYSIGQQLFKTYQNRHEGLLSLKREKIISNAALCKLGCARKIMGFIRNEPFDPKTWIIPGSNCANHILKEELLSSKKFYAGGRMKIKSKTVADVIEALIGAFLSAGGEVAALSFMAWLGINVDFVNVPYTRNAAVNPELHVNVPYLQSLLNYSFRDVSLLVEALTHGSYMLPEIPGCYQRLEFLGDALLDYLITVYLYHKYPGLSPGLLTDLRSASVNNDCYAQAAVKAELYKHVLHASPELHRQIVHTVCNHVVVPSASTFGWESETNYPKVLGDIIESLAGAIFVDSGYNMEVVFQCMRPLLEPLITPETLKLHPVRELNELCQREHYVLNKTIVCNRNGKACATVEVEASGVVYKETCSGADRKMAKRLACKAVLKSLKERMPTGE
ncbi:UNVERIFIED_CONTAM: Endoribonuclease Dicer2 [Sesamum radiatum]|uniref:Endoribonuclease Dicer2 n=1 Tax=Sesamum radiatum TaxID=300843 RepID=A0AAW2NBD3_SESRA